MKTEIWPLIILNLEKHLTNKACVFYSFMNYADFVLGTWYPKGGMYSVVEGIVSLAESLGVKFYNNSTVEKIKVKNSKVEGIIVNGVAHEFDVVISGADYHHSESLLEDKYNIA